LILLAATEIGGVVEVREGLVRGDRDIEKRVHSDAHNHL
jgi:hypothetical protein